MKRTTLTKSRLAQLAKDIQGVVKLGQQQDKSQPVCYPYIAGGLQSLLVHLTEDLAGAEAAKQIRAAFEAAYAEQGGAA